MTTNGTRRQRSQDENGAGLPSGDLIRRAALTLLLGIAAYAAVYVIAGWSDNGRGARADGGGDNDTR